jgi:hypothetical protein
MPTIINLTRYSATPDQIDCGVVNLPDHLATRLRAALTFNAMPTLDDIIGRAREIVRIATEADCVRVMIGGEPLLMAVLEVMLNRNGFQALYAFNKRVSKKVTREDGSIEEIDVFVHEGFMCGAVWIALQRDKDV